MYKNTAIGTLFLQIALGILFIVGGIWNLQSGNGDEIAVAVRSLFDGNLESTMIIVVGVVEILAGVFLILRLFLPIATVLDSILMIVVMIFWIVAVVLIDFVGGNGLFKGYGGNLLSYLHRLAMHLLVLGAIIKM